MANPELQAALAADASTLLADFGTTVVNGASTATGLLSSREVVVEEAGFGVPRRQHVLRLKAGDGGTIEVGTVLTIGGADYRVDGIEPVAPDFLFTDYVVVGGAS